jgi:dolichol-phosphate mannosyltransferase
MPLDAGDFSLMDRRVVDELLTLPETDPFLRGLRAWVGFRQAGVDFHRPQRAFGRSTNGLLRNIAWAKKGIFSFSALPIEILGYAGAGLVVVSLFALAYQIVDILRQPQRPHGIAVIIALILLFGGVNLVAISVLGEYLVRTFDASKHRPRFIRKAVRHGGRHLTSARELEEFLRTKAR